MIKVKYLPLIFALLLLACKKETLLNPKQGKTIDLKIKGYVVADTLEFVVNNKVFGKAINSSFTFNGSLLTAGDTILIRKKADSKTVGTFEVAADPYSQVKTIYYNGSTIDYKPIDLTIKGYVMADTLEFVVNDKVFGQAIDNIFALNGNLFSIGDKIIIRKKADGKTVGNIEVAADPDHQVKKIYYDGTTVDDKLELTPVTNPNNMGVRIRFSTTAIDFYGGPVDIEFFDVDENTFEITPSITVKNITATFGNFVELPSLSPNHSYYFKVYKAGTKELPYTSMEHVFLDDPDPNNNYDRIPFDKGDSKLFSISPNTYNSNPAFVGQGYNVVDFSAAFK